MLWLIAGLLALIAVLLILIFAVLYNTFRMLGVDVREILKVLHEGQSRGQSENK
jgi:hypothetical protein